MKYAVLGTGMVGHTLASKLVSLAHDVRMGARSAGKEKAMAWAKANGTLAGHGTFSDVATWADCVIFAVNGANIVDVADAVTDAAVAGKTVIDVTNPLHMSNGRPPTLVPELSNTTSAGEALQSRLPSAKVVKTLNTMNHQIMVDPARISGNHDVFLSGDHEDASICVDASVKLGRFGCCRGKRALTG